CSIGRPFRWFSDWELATLRLKWTTQHYYGRYISGSLEEEKVSHGMPIVFNDALMSEVALSCEPMVSPLNDNQIDFTISFDESDDEDYTDLAGKQIDNVGEVSIIWNSCS
ncbi:hypothetical protein Tco_0543056, partial [Tanacetum coccineum]